MFANLYINQYYKVTLQCFVLLGLLFVSGCKTMQKITGFSIPNPNPIEAYPEFNETKNKIESVFLVIDFAHTYDAYGSEDLVDVDESKKVANIVLDIVKQELEEKGYKVGGATVASIGLTIDMDRNYNKSGGEKYKVIDREVFKQIQNSVAPPFYVASSLSNKGSTDDKYFQIMLRDIFNNTSDIKSGADKNLPVIDKIVGDAGTDKIILLNMYSRDAERHAQETMAVDLTIDIISGLLSGGNNSNSRRVPGDSYIEGSFSIYDTNTGLLDWYDQKYQVSGAVNISVIEYYAKNFVKRLPALEKFRILGVEK